MTLIVRRIFEALAPDQSTEAIAKALNRDKISSRRGILRRDSSIRSHPQGGTGILKNEHGTLGP